MLKVCPGIGTNSGQSRTTTPQQAQELGADYLVIGRTITQSKDPAKTLLQIKESL
jgi:orotidine-5'-phosphate decarboxylase